MQLCIIISATELHWYAKTLFITNTLTAFKLSIYRALIISVIETSINDVQKMDCHAKRGEHVMDGQKY